MLFPLENLYVNDSINGGDNETEVLNFHENASKIMLETGFELRKWQTSSKAVGACIYSDNSMPSDELNIKVLGLWSLLENDKFSFDVSSCLKKAEMYLTPNAMFWKSSRIFPPAGFISSVSINLKILLQKLRVLKVNWDKPIPQI